MAWAKRNPEKVRESHKKWYFKRHGKFPGEPRAGSRYNWGTLSKIEYQRRWRKENREKIFEYQVAWREKNRDRVNAYQRKYNRTCPAKEGWKEKERERWRKWFSKVDREKYYEKNRARSRIYRAREDVRLKERERWRKWYIKNHEKFLESRREYERKYRELGPLKPKGELQWLRRCLALSRTAQKMLMRGQSLSQMEELITASNCSTSSPQR